MAEISILLVGNTDRSEFGRARSALHASGRILHAADVESAANALSGGQITADLIVVAQSYPGQYSRQAIERLQRLAPLARVLGLMGSWCEGEMRSGEPWPAAVRVYWHQWPARFDQEIGSMLRGECSAWGLPVTATEEERLLLRAGESTARRGGLIAIHTRPYEMQDWLSAAVRRRGCSTVWLRPPRPARVEGAVAAIFDASDCRGEEFDQLKRLAATLGRSPLGGPAPIIALLDFPRIEDHDRALAAGAAAVLSKPLHEDDLFWELDRLLEDDLALGSHPRRGIT